MKLHPDEAVIFCVYQAAYAAYHGYPSPPDERPQWWRVDVSYSRM